MNPEEKNQIVCQKAQIKKTKQLKPLAQEEGSELCLAIK